MVINQTVVENPIFQDLMTITLVIVVMMVLFCAQVLITYLLWKSIRNDIQSIKEALIKITSD